MIIMRKRVWNNPNLENAIYFLEFLIVPFETKFILPKQFPSRFENRIKTKKTLVNFGDVYIVNSSPFPNPENTTYKKLIESEGVWVVANDFLKKGEIQSENIPGKRSFMGIEINEECGNLIECFCFLEKISTSFPLSLYHGTKFTQDIHNSILKEGLQESQGMLGSCVYVGTFWKSCKYAAFTKDYHAQEGYLYRTLVMTSRIESFPRAGWECQCCNKNIADHCGLWKLIFDGVHVKNENEKGKLKNEEWGIKDRFVFITHFAKIIPYEYSPFKRNMRIV
jgi:hypothetical protein